MRGVGRAIFVAILLMIAGVVNIIYGFGAIGDAHFFDSSQYVVGNLHTWGWITVIIGFIQLTAGFSLMGGRPYGQFIGIVAASIGAIESLISVGGPHPFWSLGVFAICVIIIQGLVVLGEPKKTA